MQMTPQQPSGATDPEFTDISIKSGGYGIIDVAWKVGRACALFVVIPGANRVKQCICMTHFNFTKRLLRCKTVL